MATVRTFGIWTDVTGKGNESTGNLHGVGTNQINWGIPNLPKNPEGKQSAYRFDGVESVPLPLNGTDFLLGTFNRFNYSIILRSFSIVSAKLNLTLEIEGGLKKEFIFLFKHNETPNRGSLGTPDIVSIPRPQSEERVTIGGKEYSLSITGFHHNGEIVEQFTTLESQHNSALLYGKLVEVLPRAVEPHLQLTVAPSPPVTVESLALRTVEPPGSLAVATGTPQDQHNIVLTQPLPLSPLLPFPPIMLLGQPIYIKAGQSVYIKAGQPGYAMPGQPGSIVSPQPGVTVSPQPDITIPPQPSVTVASQSGITVASQSCVSMPATGEVVQLRPLIVTLTSSGLWSSVIEQVVGACYINGVGTNQISWGTSSNPQGFLSAYRFDSMGTRSVPLQGSYFVLGNFIHYNYPISGYGIGSVTLKLTLNINDTNVEFNFQFAHQETIKEGVNGVCPVTPGYAPPCPDVVTLASLQSQETVRINAKPYVLYILGFLQNDQIVNQFISFENQINSAQLFGKFVEIQSAAAI